MQPLISVIVPIYNVEPYLDQCIQSITGQTYQNIEIILVDDGATDRCPEMCEAWAEKDSRVHVVHKQNGGLSSARNAGLDIASGEYISFVDSDDWLLPEMIETLFREINKAHADICACGIRNCYDDREEIRKIPKIIGSATDIFALMYHDTQFPICAWNKLYRKVLWNEFRFPEGKLFEDAFTTYLLVDKANQIIQIPDALYCYRIRAGSIMTSAFTHKKMEEEEVWRCNYEFIAEHYPEHKNAAFSFYIQKVNVVIHSIPKDQREKFQGDYLRLYSILKKNLLWFLFCGEAKLKQRAKLLCDFVRL